MAREKIEVKLTMNKELWKEFKEAVINKYDSEKALSLTITSFIKDFLNENEAVKKTNTHTHETHERKKGIEDIMEWIGKNSPTGITKKTIENLIQEYKGMDSRTIRKYEPLIISKLLEDGFKQHPVNQELFIKYNL
jgi:ferritin-like metal-binding protein YciE